MYGNAHKMLGARRMNMLRRVSQFVSIVLSIIVFALPISACLTPAAEMTTEQRECCEKMAGRCEMSAMPSSHSCCQHPTSREAATASKIQSTISLSHCDAWGSCFAPATRHRSGQLHVIRVTA